MNNKILKILSFSLSGIIFTSCLSGCFKVKNDTNNDNKPKASWYHYSRISPTKITSGIKEFYYKPTSDSYSFEINEIFQEGTWTEQKKNEILNKNDDRKILSFNEIDSSLSGVAGSNPFDFIKINETKKYLKDNYTDTEKSIYEAESSLITNIENTYDTTFTTLFDMENVIYDNECSDVLSAKKDLDDVYENLITIKTKSDILGSSKSYISFNSFTSYLDEMLESINFCAYASSSTSISFELKFNDKSSDLYKVVLPSGWNKITLTENDSLFKGLTNFSNSEKTLNKLNVVLTSDLAKDSEIKIGSLFGKLGNINNGIVLKNKINQLPSKEQLNPYDISLINSLLNEYQNLTEKEKNYVINIEIVNELKTYWESLYVLLYDMNEDYATFDSDGIIKQSKLFDEKCGYAKHVSFDQPGTYLKLNNINNAFTNETLGKLFFKIKPKYDSVMSFKEINISSDTLTADSWNEFVINDFNEFMNYAKNNSVIKVDFANNNDSYLKTKDFCFDMTSIIGFKEQDKTVANLISKINEVCSGGVSLEKVESLANIELAFNSLTTAKKEKITNIEDFYSYKELFNLNYPYLFSPSTKLLSLHQKTFISDSDFIYNQVTKYGLCYKFRFSQANYGANITIDEKVGQEVENDGFYVFVKNIPGDLKLYSHEPTYNTLIATATKENLGDGWVKFSFSKSVYNSITKYKNNRLAYCFGNVQSPANVDFYMSGTFFIPVTNKSNKETVQSHINTVNSLEIDEFVVNKIVEVQKEIVSLSTVDQASLSGISLLTSKYSKYKEKYSNVYSMNVYRIGTWWNGGVSSITKSYDANYGDIYSIFTDKVNGPYLTLGCWELNGTKGSHRGYGRNLSPVPNGKYNSISFAIYSPVSGSTSIKCWNDGDNNFDLMSKNLNIGWNKVTMSGSELDKLCGVNGDFKGLSFTLPIGSTSESVEYKISSFVGEKNKNYTGESEHYSQNSLHQGSYNIESTDFVLSSASSSNYKFVSSSIELTKEAIGFINNEFNKVLSTQIETISTATPSSNSRYIFVGEKLVMDEMGIDIPSKDVLGDTGYLIKTIGSSVYIFAYGKEGYELAAAKFLEAAIGYDWMSNDMINYEKNGAIFTTSITVYTPNFNIVERPDYENRFHSNYPSSHIYGSYLETPTVYNPKCCDVYHYLDTTTFKDCYYQIKVDETLHINASVACLNAKGNQARRDEMIKTVGDKMIENYEVEVNGKKNSGYPFASFFQGDTSSTCTCSSCQNDLRNHGSASYTLVKFMNDVDNYIKSYYNKDKIKLLFLAYQGTFNPPTGITCNEDVIPFIAPSGARWNHSFYEIENSSSVGENGYTYDNDFAGKMQAWSSICSDYVLWAYQAQNSGFFYVYNTFESMYLQYRFFENNGCGNMFNEGVTSCASSGFVTLKDYLDSKALFDVNGSYDDVYEKFFKYYYGEAGELMRIIFDEAINNVNFLADEYGRGNNYNPSSHPGQNTYYDGVMDINCYTNINKFWNNTGDCYNGNNGKCNGKNLANIPYWVLLANEAVNLTEHGDPVIFSHVQRDVIFPYFCDYEINGTSTYVGRICKYCYDTKCYWKNETDMRTDSYQGLDGTHTICYQLTGKTFKQMYE